MGEHLLYLVTDGLCYYRLAPEDPFPAAVEDSWEGVLWVLDQGKELLGLDTSKLATGKLCLSLIAKS